MPRDDPRHKGEQDSNRGGQAVKIFAVRGRRITAAGPEVSGPGSASVRSGLPHRFEALGEALISGSDVLDVCAVAGQDLARDGASMQETLEGLRTTWQQLTASDPSFEVVSALLTAWSDTTLGYLHQLSCDDPLTGLSSQAHLRSRISELYRLEEATGTIGGHALVLCAIVYLGYLEGVAGIVAGVVAAYLLITGLLARCVIYKAIGVDTSVQEQPYSTTDERAGF